MEVTREGPQLPRRNGRNVVKNLKGNGDIYLHLKTKAYSPLLGTKFNFKRLGIDKKLKNKTDRIYLSETEVNGSQA